MTGLVKAELLKLATTRTAWMLALAAVLTGAIPALAFILPGTDVEMVDLGGTLPGVLIGGVELAAFLVLLLGVLGTAGEFHHRTAVGTFLTTPSRMRVIAAKLPAYALAGAVVSLFAALAAVAIVPPLAEAKGIPVTLEAGEALRATLASMGIGALFGALGVGIGGLIRNQTAAALLAVGWFLVLESMVPLALGDEAAEWMPGNAAAGIAGLVETGARVGFVVLCAWAAAAAVAASLAIARRDVA